MRNMRKYLKIVAILMITNLIMAISVHAQSEGKKNDIIGKEVTYKSGDVALKGYVAYDGSKKAERPAIIIVHEWWGSNEYVRTRARMLAELGYIAMAVDMYGDGKIADDPKTAGEYATPFYKNPAMAKERIEAAVEVLKKYPETNVSKMAAIGYCFGGSMVLNAAKMGMDFKGVVSFHGGLAGVPATTGTTKGKILVCHGGADKFISDDEISTFKSNLDSVKVPYQFIVYPGATHAFTNPEATAKGKKFKMPIEYNEAGDKKSWNDMKTFFKKIFK